MYTCAHATAKIDWQQSTSCRMHFIRVSGARHSCQLQQTIHGLWFCCYFCLAAAPFSKITLFPHLSGTKVVMAKWVKPAYKCVSVCVCALREGNAAGCCIIATITLTSELPQKNEPVLG